MVTDLITHLHWPESILASEVARSPRRRGILDANRKLPVDAAPLKAVIKQRPVETYRYSDRQS
jgi:hypothetical protein